MRRAGSAKLIATGECDVFKRVYPVAFALEEMVDQLEHFSACVSRLARMVFPGLPHHVTQRGNRREAIFFEDGDQQLYCDMLGEQLRKFRVEVWAYCLMPNHVDLILTPQERTRHEPGLRRSASPVCKFHPCAWPIERSFISEPVRVGRHGRVAPEVCGIVRQSESGSGPTCVSCPGIDVVECASTPRQ